jgi:hypothetical protein
MAGCRPTSARCVTVVGDVRQSTPSGAYKSKELLRMFDRQRPRWTRLGGPRAARACAPFSRTDSQPRQGAPPSTSPIWKSLPARNLDRQRGSNWRTSSAAKLTVLQLSWAGPAPSMGPKQARCVDERPGMTGKLGWDSQAGAAGTVGRRSPQESIPRNARS